ncbi:50S ribosomal subunit protein L25 [Candidatus Vidania fulgoroideae]|nr:50S ribosomal subunit protein L25 [Candidatus Vidania fulgoroideae]
MFNPRFFFRIRKIDDFVSVNLEVKKKTFITLSLKKEDANYIISNTLEKKIVFGKKKMFIFLKEINRNPETDIIENLSLFLYIKNKKVSLPIVYSNFKDSPLVKNKKLSVYINIRKLKVIMKKKTKRSFLEINLKNVKKRIKINDVVLPEEYAFPSNYKKNMYLISLKKKR